MPTLHEFVLDQLALNAKQGEGGANANSGSRKETTSVDDILLVQDAEGQTALAHWLRQATRVGGRNEEFCLILKLCILIMFFLSGYSYIFFGAFKCVIFWRIQPIFFQLSIQSDIS